MDKQLDLLLVNPGGRKGVYQGLQDADLTAIETPVWCGLIASFIRKHGFHADILDANCEGLDAEHVRAVICGRSPHNTPKLVAVVCYGQQPSASTQTMPEAIAVAKDIKAMSPEQKVIMVGGHVAALPQRTLEESGADYVATGEGCHTILDILQGKSVEAGDVRGLGFQKGMELLIGDEVQTHPAYWETHAAPNVADVNDMQVPWADLPPSKYRAHNWQCLGGWPRTPYAALYTSLGCPYKCHFCCIQAPFREGDGLGLKQGLALLNAGASVPNSYRLWNPDGIGQQIADLYYTHGCRTFKVADEMFVLNKRHVEGVCDAILSRITNPADALNIWAYARVDTANDEKLLAKMRSAGFRWLCLGIESASESVRDGIDKGYAQDKIKDCCDRIKNAGIHVLANYIVGLPGDTLESMQQTLDLAIELNTPWMNIYASMPYPGSPMWDDYPEHHDLPWEAFSQHSRETHPTRTATLTSAQVLEFRDKAWLTYFTGQRYLTLVGDLWGQGAVDEVLAMTKHKLHRNLLEKQPCGSGMREPITS